MRFSDELSSFSLFLAGMLLSRLAIIHWVGSKKNVLVYKNCMIKSAQFLVRPNADLESEKWLERDRRNSKQRGVGF